MLEDESLPAQFARAVEQLSDDLSVIDRYCEAVRRILHANGVGLTINHHRPDRYMLSATTMLSMALEDTQDIVGEGPSFDASRRCQVVQVTLPGPAPSRWPLLADALTRLGFDGTVVAIPLIVGERSIGVMTAHRSDTTTEFDHAVAQFFSCTLGAVLAEELTKELLEKKFTAAWSSRALIYQAEGMVVSQMRVEVSTARSLIRAHAYANDQTLADVAVQIIERELVFRSDDA